MSGLPAPRPDLVRVLSPRRGALPAAAAVALLLAAVVSAGLLGRSGPDVSVSRSTAAAVVAAIGGIEAAVPPRLGPPPWVSDGRRPAPSSSRLRVLSWQADPYET